MPDVLRASLIRFVQADLNEPIIAPNDCFSGPGFCRGEACLALSSCAVIDTSAISVKSVTAGDACVAPTLSLIKTMPCRWFGIMMNSSRSTYGKCSGICCQHSCTTLPNDDVNTVPLMISANIGSFWKVQMVTK